MQISSHADYRRQDYVFERTQSRAMGQRAWAARADRMHSWSELVYPAAGLAGAALVVMGVML